MASVAYVGTSESGILDTPYTFSAFGQLVEMPDDLMKRAVLGGIALIPAAEFGGLGFTPEELARDFSSLHVGGAVFEEKLRKSWAVLGKHRTALERPAES